LEGVRQIKILRYERKKFEGKKGFGIWIKSRKAGLSQEVYYEIDKILTLNFEALKL